MTSGPWTLQFTNDPDVFLASAQTLLAADPVLTTVMSSVTHRAAGEAAAGVAAPDHPRWWVTVRDRDGDVVGAAMRTAPFPPYPAYVLPMPEAAARAVAGAVHERGEELTGANGSLPAADVLVTELARLTGGSVRTQQHTRLFELGDPVPPRPAPGRLRAAEEDDVDLVLAWFGAFREDADEQAGRAPGTGFGELHDRADMLRRIRVGGVWFWVDADGDRVHLTAANPPSFGVARVGPVYTPREHRGRGYASAAVHEVSLLLRDRGAQVCLFTDQANPVSNRIYEALGFRPVVDMANLVVDRPRLDPT